MLYSRKSLFIFALIILFVFLLSFFERAFSFSLFAKKFGVKEQFFVKTSLQNAKYEGMFFVVDDVGENEVLGEFACFDKEKLSLDEIKIFFNAKEVFFEKIDDKKVIYLYSNLLKKEVKADRFTFNLQVIITDKHVEIYYPINFGSF